MTILTDESLKQAIKLCQDNKCYRVLIVTKYAGDHTRLLDRLSEVGADVVRRLGRPWARFLNGSSITMLSSAANTRGCKADLVLYQEDVCCEGEEMWCILASIEMNNRNFKLLSRGKK